MNEIPLIEDSQDVQQLHVLTSSKAEIDNLARELADSYIDYFTIDISEQQRKTEESIEECLTHLEEVCSVLDNYRQNADELPNVVETMAYKNNHLDKLYDQVDALEQYIFETTRLLDHLETTMKELENYKKISGNRIRQIIDLIPRLSLGSMPRLGLLNSFSGLIEEAGPSFVDERNNDNSTTSISEILNRISNIEASLTIATSSLNTRLHSEELTASKVQDSSMAMLDCESPEQVDDSWQELL